MGCEQPTRVGDVIEPADGRRRRRYAARDSKDFRTRASYRLLRRITGIVDDRDDSDILSERRSVADWLLQMGNYLLQEVARHRIAHAASGNSTE